MRLFWVYVRAPVPLALPSESQCHFRCPLIIAIHWIPNSTTVFSDGTNNWKVNKRGLQIERPPVYADTPQESADAPSVCFATTYFWLEKEQVIDLLANGIDKLILDQVQPLIEVSEW